MSVIDSFIFFVNTYIGAFNNILATIGILIPTVTLFLLFRPLVEPLSKLLSPCGFQMRNLPRLFWVFGNRARIRLRCFIELALVRTEGKFVKPSAWDEIIREFITHQSKETANRPLISVNNCTCLTDASFSKCVSEYMKYFFHSRRRRHYNILHTEIPSFRSVVRIENAYMMPEVLISGLLSRYQDDWRKVIELYVSTANDVYFDDSSAILPQELSFTYAWMMWGPSYQISNQDNSCRLLQISFGDDANSIHGVICNDDKGDALWHSLDHDFDTMGDYASIDCTLYCAHDYISQLNFSFVKDARYFLDRFDKQEGEKGIILEIEDIDRKRSSSSRNYYCTTYLWILFEVVDPNRISFQPSKVVAFFEHANLANAQHTEFLVDCLVNKCLNHFRVIFNHPEYGSRKYRLCMASNKAVEESFLQLYRRYVDSGDQVLADRLCTEPARSPTTVFRAIDDFFTRSIGDYRIIEVQSDDEESLSLLGRFYTETYGIAFDNVNERETLDNIVDYLKKKKAAWYGKNNYHVLLCVDPDDNVIGGIIFDYFYSCNAGVVEFVAVNRKYRMNGYGTRLYDTMTELLLNDAKKAGKKKIDWIICEIEDPGTVDKTKPISYLFFWEKLKYARLGMKYIQPALSKDKRPVESLWLIALGMKDGGGVPGIPKNTVKHFICDYAKYAMHIDEPGDDPSVQAMFRDMDRVNEEVIPLESLGTIAPRYRKVLKNDRRGLS